MHLTPGSVPSPGHNDGHDGPTAPRGRQDPLHPDLPLMFFTAFILALAAISLALEAVHSSAAGGAFQMGLVSYPLVILASVYVLRTGHRSTRPDSDQGLVLLERRAGLFAPVVSHVVVLVQYELRGMGSVGASASACRQEEGRGELGSSCPSAVTSFFLTGLWFVFAITQLILTLRVLHWARGGGADDGNGAAAAADDDGAGLTVCSLDDSSDDGYSIGGDCTHMMTDEEMGDSSSDSDAAKDSGKAEGAAQVPDEEAA